MPVYMVERNLKGISMEDLGGAQKAAIGKAAELSAGGEAVRYIPSVAHVSPAGSYRSFTVNAPPLRPPTT